MTKLSQDNVPCTWCIRAVPISVFSRGDNNYCGISKGMKITRTAYSKVNKNEMNQALGQLCAHIG